MKIVFTREMVLLDPQIRDQLRTAMSENHVELDFNNLDYIDSTGLDMVTKLCKEIHGRGGIVKAMNMNRPVWEILDICGTLSLLEV